MKSVTEIVSFVQSFWRVFTKPSYALFTNLVEGWILCPSRRFVTSIFTFGDQAREHAHDAYHRFFRNSGWVLPEFFHALASFVVASQGHPGILTVIGDDTVHKKTGKKVEGAKSCRDAVKSTAKRVVYAWGLQIVLLCLEVQAPWGGEPLALPINMRLYRKRPTKTTGKSLLDLMWEMILEIQEWFPDQLIRFVGDGFYAPLAKRTTNGIIIISRIRHDAAIFCMPPKPVSGKRGRKPTKGQRLPTPLEIAQTGKDWKSVETIERGEKRTRLVLIRHVLWHKVRRGECVRLVISRDSRGVEKDDFFFTTDLNMDPGLLISCFSNRWSIEDTFRNAKQFLGIEQPQSYKFDGPQKVAALGYAIYSLVWLGFIQNGEYTIFPNRPWYSAKVFPSFLDALAQIRHKIWLQRKSECVHSEAELNQFHELLIESLSRAA
jgi:hypothetical protein